MNIREYKRISGKKERLELDVLYVPIYIFRSHKLLNNNINLNVELIK